MKKLVNLPTWPIKLLLVLGFLGNLGVQKIPSYISNLNPSVPDKHKNVPLMDRLKADSVVNQFVIARRKVAELKVQNHQGSGYTIYDYFNDLASIRSLEDSLGSILNHTCGGDFTTLWSLGMKDLRTRPDDDSALAKAQAMYADRMDPGWREYEKKVNADPYTWADFFAWLLRTLKLQYMRNFLLAFVLFLVWKYEGTEKKNLKLRSPLSFIICLLIYPVTIGYVWRMKWKGILDEAEIRSRREKLFSVISSDELAIVTTLRSKLSLRDAKVELDLTGATRRYSLISVLLAMCIMSFLPKPSFGKAERSDDKREAIYTMKMDQPIHPVVEISNILPDDYPDMKVSDDNSLEKIFEQLIVFLTNVFYFLLLKGARRVLDPVPLSALAFRN